MTNKIDTFLKAINDRMTGALPSDTVKNPKLIVNPTYSILSARSYLMEDPQSSSNPFKSANVIKTCFKSTTTFLKDQLCVKTLTVNEIETSKSKEPKEALEDEFKDLHLNLPVLEVLAHALIYNAILSEETKNVLGLANGTKSYPVGIVRNVEVHVGKLKLLEDFYVIDMEKDPTYPLVIGRGFLATASAVIDCKKAKIAVGERIIRTIFRVNEINLGVEDVPYWTTIGKRESDTPRPSTDGIGSLPFTMQRKTVWIIIYPGSGK
ncbi:MAK10-like protein [Tanacetum coccineum]